MTTTPSPHQLAMAEVDGPWSMTKALRSNSKTFVTSLSQNTNQTEERENLSAVTNFIRHFPTGETLIGWYNDADSGQRGCYRAQKSEDV
jgi:hypothetical protein